MPIVSISDFNHLKTSLKLADIPSREMHSLVLKASS